MKLIRKKVNHIFCILNYLRLFLRKIFLHKVGKWKFKAITVIMTVFLGRHGVAFPVRSLQQHQCQTIARSLRPAQDRVSSSTYDLTKWKVLELCLIPGALLNNVNIFSYICFLFVMKNIVQLLRGLP